MSGRGGTTGAPADAEGPRRLRVLVVDDDVVVPMVLGLELDGIEVLEASRLHTGREQALRLLPDAVIVDLRLPDGDGLDLVRSLRVTAPTRQTPIIVLTAGHDPEEEPRVLRAGADAYLAKPQDGAVLEALLRHLCALPGADLRPRRTALAQGRDVVAVAEPERPEPRRRRFRRS
jgi:DNA-binding response OmpR family regulator